MNPAIGYTPENCRWATWSEQKASGVSGRFSGQFTPNKTAKLTPDNVRSIKMLFPDKTNACIAKQFGVSQTTISNIRKGRSWGAIG
jgi:uncharacterized protein YerC